MVITRIYTYVKIHRIVTRKEKKSTLLYDSKKNKIKRPLWAKIQIILNDFRASQV